MPVKRTYKASEIEKRLKILESQLYGKKLDVRSEKLENEVRSSTLDQTSNFQSQNLSSNIQHPTSTSDLTYLKHDLTKIAIFSSLAIAIQLVLYLNHALERVKLF